MKINGRVCVPRLVRLREDMLEEAHKAPYAMHLGDCKNVMNRLTSLLVADYEER